MKNSGQDVTVHWSKERKIKRYVFVICYQVVSGQTEYLEH